MKNSIYKSAIAGIILAAGVSTSLYGQAAGQQRVAPTAEVPKKGLVASVAVEADALAYALPGYSGIVSVTLRNRLQFAAGQGRYEVPGFLLKGDDNYEAAQWKATSTSVQVFRMTYRFNGAMKNGPALGGVFLNQNWRVKSERLGGETTFRPMSAGLTGGYYFHVGKHFYIYPTVAFTRNWVHSGDTSVRGVKYDVAKWGPNGSVHVGWEWGL